MNSQDKTASTVLATGGGPGEGVRSASWLESSELDENDFKQGQRALLDGIDAIVWEADATRRQYTFVSRQAEDVLGYSVQSWMETPGFWQRVVLGEDLESATSLARKAIAAANNYAMEYRVTAADGRVVWIHERVCLVRGPHGSVTGLRGLMVDITQFKETRSKPENLAAFDALTRLPNRILLLDRTDQALAQAERDTAMTGVLAIGLDRFKNINDSLGHDAGDIVLATTAERLAGCIRDVDTLARLGGDEFVIVLCGIDREESVTRVAQAVLNCLAEPFAVDGHDFYLTASIGISTYPKDGPDALALLKNADSAMHRAKESGKNRFEFFTQEMNDAMRFRLKMESELRQALAADEFVLHYQPQIALANGKVIGLEALLRWHHPERGLVSPAEFIPLAEETGLIIAIGEWVLKSACNQARAWQDRGLPPVRVAVNLSALHFQDRGLIPLITQTLRETGLDAHYLELEVTENVLLHHTEENLANLHALKDTGVRLSVDDFGTGYSSLSYLKSMPVNTVKIDQGFVKNLTTDPGDAALVKAIIAMAHSLNLRAIAEGVETEGQLAFLASQHCDEIQGYYFSRPLPVDECTQFLHESHMMTLPRFDAAAAEQVLLLVDDEPNITNALRRLLRQDGYRILVAGSGQEGLELLATNPIGVIISDQRMPEMTGVEFFQRVKQLYPDTIRMVLSGYTELKSVTDAINEGAIYKFITKPWEDDLLREHVKEAFQRHGMKQENLRLTEEIAQANRKLSEINQDLELRVEEKTREIQHSMRVLEVSQEVLEHLPAAVIGVDTDGLIVMANHQADALLADDSEPLLGCDAHARLPAAICGCLNGEGDLEQTLSLEDGRVMHVICNRLGGGRVSTGTVLVLLPQVTKK